MSRINDIPLPSRLIPGGAHTYSKGDDQFPSIAPAHLERGEGCRVWDQDGRSYIDWTMGLRTMTLGYGRRDVDEAAIEQIRKGLNFARPSRIEGELAQDLIDLIPAAEMVKFAKNGSTVTTAAVKLARAHTGRRCVAFCQDHPFYSYDDWFIGTTEANAGIPEEHYRFSLPFRYNDLASLQRQFDAHLDDIAAVIMEACVAEPPEDDFLHRVAELCRSNGAVFILDEMITGFRWSLGGAQEYFGVTPDLATFGKGIANGYSVSALVGRRDIMELGGLYHEKPRVFLISTTHGAENLGLAAARACLRIYREEPVIEQIWATGRKLIDGLNHAAREAGIADRFSAFGYPCRPEYQCLDAEGAISAPMRTLLNQELVRRGVLLSYIVPAYAHAEADIEATIDAAREAFAVYARALENGWEPLLEGQPFRPVFRKYN